MSAKVAGVAARAVSVALLLACLPLAGLAQAQAAVQAQSQSQASTPAPAQSQSQVPTPADAAAAAARAGKSAREFLGLGPPPDTGAAQRGAPVFAANCAFCHGPLARGAEGPSLIYSELVLKDQQGALIAEFLKGGRPEKGMPAFATLGDEQRHDVAEFLHQQIEDVANRGTYQVKNIVLGDPKKGATYVAAHCLQCHAVTGDLKGLASKWRPVDLQRYWIMPPRTSDGRALTATVRGPQGTWQGRVQQIDDFRVVLVEGSGPPIVITRDADVAVELHDPLAPHVALVGNLADSDMINVTAYLETLK
jgi:cytochrome c oxidase cbb3-type subunit III